MAESDDNTPKKPAVQIMQNGPIILKGNFSFRDSSGKILTGEQEIRLCRCGESKNMPFCDCSHENKSRRSF
jgi:CDGSH-type Zn-finger protein